MRLHFLLVVLITVTNAVAELTPLERQTALDAMNYEFTVVGLKHKFDDHKIDWSINPTYNACVEWPCQFARHLFLPPLAKYYAETKDERAAETFVDIVNQFIDNTKVAPPNHPAGAVNDEYSSWRTIDTGERATSWVKSYFIFTNSPAVTPAFKKKFVESIKNHVTRLRPSKTSNNWRLIELKGLVDILLNFPEIGGREKLLKDAEKELKLQLESQVYPDGFQFELAPGYHSILDSDYTELADSYRERGRTPPDFMTKDVRRCFEMYMHLADSFLRTPNINDAGKTFVGPALKRALKLDPDNEVYKYFATKRAEGHPPEYLSCVMPYAGMVTFRNSWDADGIWAYVDMGPVGRSHQHEDKLNFLMNAYGTYMLIEAGVFMYDSSLMRKYVLSTRAHNTIRIDGLDQNRLEGYHWEPSMLTRKANLTFEIGENKDVAEATYDSGYGSGENATDKVTHTRKVEFIKDDGKGRPFFRITDTLLAKDAKVHSYEQMWHLSESCENISLTDNSFKATFSNGAMLEAAFKSENGKLTDMIGTKEPEMQGWIPIHEAGPHEHRPIHTPVLKGTFKKKAVIKVILRPRPAK